MTLERLLADPDTFVETHLAVTEYYRLDAPAFYYDIYNIEAEALGQPLNWMPEMFPEIKASDMLVKSEADLDRLKPPDPGKDGRMPFIIQMYKKVIDLGIQPQFRFCAPFTLACNIRGLSNVVMDIMMQPEFAHRLFRFIADDVLAPWITALRRECGGDFMAVGADALASLPVTNLAILEEYALGYIKRLDKELGNVQVKGWWGEMHLADPTKLMELKLQGHPSNVQALDPDVHHHGPELFKKFAQQQDIPLLLGIDCSLLSQGPPEAIVQRVKEYVRVGNRGGKFLLFLNEVPPDCPPEHVHAAVQAAHHYGRKDASFEGDFQPRPREPFNLGDTVKDRAGPVPRTDLIDSKQWIS